MNAIMYYLLSWTVHVYHVYDSILTKAPYEHDNVMRYCPNWRELLEF